MDLVDAGALIKAIKADETLDGLTRRMAAKAVEAAPRVSAKQVRPGLWLVADWQVLGMRRVDVLVSGKPRTKKEGRGSK